jgi:hypothetical protein
MTTPTPTEITTETGTSSVSERIAQRNMQGMRNTLKSLLDLQRRTSETDRYFPSTAIHIHGCYKSWSAEEPIWLRGESPRDAREALESLELAQEKGYLDRAVVSIGPNNYICFRIVQYKMPEIERMIGGND